MITIKAAIILSLCFTKKEVSMLFGSCNFLFFFFLGCPCILLNSASFSASFALSSSAIASACFLALSYKYLKLINQTQAIMQYFKNRNSYLELKFEAVLNPKLPGV